jgi:HK97 family phage major capsid protein
MSFVALARKALESRGRLFEEYKSVLNDTKLGEGERSAHLARLDKAIEEKSEEIRDFTSKAEAEAEARNLDGKLGKLFTPGAQDEAAKAPEVDARSILLAVANGEIREGVITPDMAMRAAGANVSANAGTVASAAFAGNTTSVQFVAQVQEVMREHSPFLNLVSTFTTSHGETIRYPVKNAWLSSTSDVQAPMAEGDKYIFGKGGFTTKDLTVAKYGTGVQLSAELLTDSEVDIAGIAADDAGTALSDRITADMLAKLQAAVPAGKKVTMVGAAATTPVSYDNLIDIQHTLRTGYRKNAVWLFGDGQLAYLRKIKDSTGQPIWNPSYLVGQPDTLLGKSYVTDATITAKAVASGNTINTDVIWYGDFSKFKLRQVKGITVARSDEYAWDSDMVSWKLTFRGGGDLMDLEAVAALRTAAA